MELTHRLDRRCLPQFAKVEASQLAGIASNFDNRLGVRSHELLPHDRTVRKRTPGSPRYIAISLTCSLSPFWPYIVLRSCANAWSYNSSGS